MMKKIGTLQALIFYFIRPTKENFYSFQQNATSLQQLPALSSLFTDFLLFLILLSHFKASAWGFVCDMWIWDTISMFSLLMYLEASVMTSWHNCRDRNLTSVYSDGSTTFSCITLKLYRPHWLHKMKCDYLRSISCLDGNIETSGH